LKRWKRRSQDALALENKRRNSSCEAEEKKNKESCLSRVAFHLDAFEDLAVEAERRAQRKSSLGGGVKRPNSPHSTIASTEKEFFRGFRRTSAQQNRNSPGFELQELVIETAPHPKNGGAPRDRPMSPPGDCDLSMISLPYDDDEDEESDEDTAADSDPENEQRRGLLARRAPREARTEGEAVEMIEKERMQHPGVFALVREEPQTQQGTTPPPPLLVSCGTEG
jgi:hypothetical protein